ncbi:hypothetical protein HKCCE3408_07900 [Rhodobacterales bacterium HKCCE3408]|nr:hypothetical protein [Rhodobacterales bacterium HKCCE3408]
MFILVNLVAAVAFGALAYREGYGIGGIALRVVVVLIAIQVCYVLWLVISAWLSPSADEDTAETETAGDTVNAARKTAQRSAR